MKFLTALFLILFLSSVAFAGPADEPHAAPIVPVNQMTLPDVAPVVTIQSDGGGRVILYIKRIGEYFQNGTFVRIDGECASACTLLTMLHPDKVCVTDNAALEFHAPFDGNTGEHHPEWTRAMRAMYPIVIRKWIDNHGGLTPTLIILKGDDLQKIYHACQDI